MPEYGTHDEVAGSYLEMWVVYTCSTGQERYLAQERDPYDLVIGSVDFGGFGFSQFVVRYSIDPQNHFLLECPCGHIVGELSVSGFLATGRGVSNVNASPHKPSPQRVLLGEIVTK